MEEATVAGQPAWVIAFEPTGGDLPVRRRVDRVLNKIAGKLWINMKDYEISRAEAHLTERVRMVGGLVASINDFALKLEQRPLDATTWVPAHMDLYIDGRIMLTSLHQRIKTIWQEYRRAGATVADGRP